MFDDKTERIKGMLQELMEVLDEGESEKIKPKVASVEVAAIEPKEEVMPEEKMSSNDEMSDDDLKRLMQEYCK